VSRKNLSRTVIEGGRDFYNSWQRRASSADERASTREWLSRVMVDAEEAEATAPPRRRPVRKSFHDKLGPAQRWLASQVGRPWDKVYSELCARFDTRTVAGRHVVHDHLLHWVLRNGDPQPYYRRYDLVVDAHGILRKPYWFRRSYAKLRAKALTWAARRRCALTLRGWWWFRLQRTGVGTPEFRATWVGIAPMTRADVRYLHRLPPELRKEFVIPDPQPSR